MTNEDEDLLPAEEERKLTGKKVALYSQIIEWVFNRHFKLGAADFVFPREDLSEAARELFKAGATDRETSKNLGDVIYTFRHRRALPPSIRATEPPDRAWLILGAGDAKYRFRLNRLTHLVPASGKKIIPIPDATPEIIVKYTKQDDEQALLAKLRYNRLIDTFLGITTYSIQNHLRTKIPNYGQIEIDELYVGVDRDGRHYVVPVQAKGPKDKLGVIQTIQDVTYCRTPPSAKKRAKKDFTALKCRPVSAQVIRRDGEEIIALFELDFDGDEVVEVEQRHYKLVPADKAIAEP